MIESDEEPTHQSALNVDALAPTSLRHIVGQDTVVRQLVVAIDAAQMDGTKMEHGLLVGPAGLGKTAIAHVIAREMAAEHFMVFGQSIKDVSDLNLLLLSARNRDVVHIDEAHELKSKFQTALYLAIDRRGLIVTGGSVQRTIPIADFTLLLSTTDEHRLLPPLRDRMRLLLQFDFCSVEDLARLLRYRSEGLHWEVEDRVLSSIAVRARGTPRLALNLLQACFRLCRAAGERRITLSHLLQTCELEQIDNLGLGPRDLRYLELVRHGPSRLGVISSTLGLATHTVSDVVEPFLLRSGLIVKDDQRRRQLTASGREHLLHSGRGGA
jgi:Holliday junction DNA helicase RuvB